MGDNKRSCLQREQRIGATTYNNQGCLMKIIEYNNSTNIIVEFQDEYKAKVKSRYDHFLDKTICNPYCNSVFGIGKLGKKFDYLSNKKEYRAWYDMIRRCYDINYHKNHPTYINCSVCEEWKSFDNFCNWIKNQSNYLKWKNNSNFHIDKDILYKNNKIYSPNTCTLVPSNINCLFIKANAVRGKNPIGVSENYKNSGNYVARCGMNNGKDILVIGEFNTPELAFQAYKIYKENLIKEIAKKEYKKKNISIGCYNAMINYEVEIFD